MKAKSNNTRLHRAGLMLCPHCGKSQGEFVKINFDYFYGARPHCIQCGSKIDWWEAILKTVKQEANILCDVLAPIGARIILLQFFLKPGKILTINFDDHDIPEDANILEIDYSPQCDFDNQAALFPIEMHGNTPLRHTIEHKIRLYPRPIIEDRAPQETRLIVMVTWVPKTPDDEVWQYLVDAFEAYSRDHFQNCILPANVAVESKLMRLLSRYLTQFCSKKRTDDFLENGATYSHQLNVLLPLAAGQLGLPLLPDHIRGLLNRLRVHRNEVAHSGQTEQEISKDSASELIVAALFGFHYLSLFESKLNEKPPGS